MDNRIYIPDLDDADFRRLIDARKLVVIRFWSPEDRDLADETILEAAARHSEVAFAQSDVSQHLGLMHRVQVSSTPTLQGWVSGSLVEKHEGAFSLSDIDELIEKMGARVPKA